MRTAIATILLLLVTASANAQLRLSFVGYSATNDPRPIGSFDETIDDTLVIDLSGMRAPGPDPGWFLSWGGSGHAANGYPALPNTIAWTACGRTDPNNSYDLIAWLEPGEFMIGQQVGQGGHGPRTNFIHGDDWLGHMPWEFTHLRVVLVGETYANQFDGPYCLKTYLIPIVWQEAPVSSKPSTFGAIKALYRTKGDKP